MNVSVFVSGMNWSQRQSNQLCTLGPREGLTFLSLSPNRSTLKMQIAKKEINYLYQDIFIHRSVGWAIFVEPKWKGFDGVRGAKSIDPKRIQWKKRIESSVSDGTKTLSPPFEKEDTWVPRIKNGIWLNSQKALDTWKFVLVEDRREKKCQWEGVSKVAGSFAVMLSVVSTKWKCQSHLCRHHMKPPPIMVLKK